MYVCICVMYTCGDLPAIYKNVYARVCASLINVCRQYLCINMSTIYICMYMYYVHGVKRNSFYVEIISIMISKISKLTHRTTVAVVLVW